MVFSSRLCVGTERSHNVSFGGHLVSNAGQSWGTPTILLGEPGRFSYFTSNITVFSPSALTLTTGALSHRSLCKKKIRFSTHATAQEIGSVIRGGLSFSTWNREKNHLHLIILQWHSWVLSAQELSFTGSIILLCDRGLGLETQVYNRLPDLQTEVWSCNYQSLY